MGVQTLTLSTGLSCWSDIQQEGGGFSKRKTEVTVTNLFLTIKGSKLRLLSQPSWPGSLATGKGLVEKEGGRGRFIGRPSGAGNGADTPKLQKKGSACLVVCRRTVKGILRHKNQKAQNEGERDRKDRISYFSGHDHYRWSSASRGKKRSSSKTPLSRHRPTEDDERTKKARKRKRGLH